MCDSNDMRDYSKFFTSVVAGHLHKLVDLVKDSYSQKVLVHQWVLGIEHNWSEYVVVSNNTSEFIPRLLFWIGGLREQFNSNPSKRKVIELLNKIFDVSTFCFFEYGARHDVEEQIKEYCKEVDDWFGEDILTHKFKKFKFSQNVIELVNDAFKKLIYLGVDSKKINNIKISKRIETSSDLEKEFNKLVETIIKLSINYTISPMNDVIKYLKDFLEKCHKLGYSKNMLLIRIMNVFRRPLKNIDVSLNVGNHTIVSQTNDNGEAVFMNAYNGNVTLSLNYKKNRIYSFEINELFNRKNIWLFSL